MKWLLLFVLMLVVATFLFEDVERGGITELQATIAFLGLVLAFAIGTRFGKRGDVRRGKRIRSLLEIGVPIAALLLFGIWNGWAAIGPILALAIAGVGIYWLVIK